VHVSKVSTSGRLTSWVFCGFGPFFSWVGNSRAHTLPSPPQRTCPIDHPRKRDTLLYATLLTSNILHCSLQKSTHALTYNKLHRFRPPTRHWSSRDIARSLRLCCCRQRASSALLTKPHNLSCSLFIHPNHHLPSRPHCANSELLAPEQTASNPHMTIGNKASTDDLASFWQHELAGAKVPA
jgi:hypothetical protein